ncbi:hypothetical protein GXM_07549 [Nostoc sphaeroides CCNUC1]|uniref:Uncharacterized protein n=1 Tax=Nostoc sphaeroides CCNUC1 TaxID=2653204 RepID=A0A5P8WB91_9NOSO|nr:hypothetical protein GXM_07549 [Nostoc sphaeroides CCNUC1]
MLQYITHVYVSKNFSNILLSQNDTILEMSIEECLDGAKI